MIFFTGGLPINLNSLPSRVQQMHKQLTEFIDQNVFPNEAEFNRHQSSEDRWTPHPMVEQIKVDIFDGKGQT